MTIPYWQTRRQDLLSLAAKTCPLYVYHEERLNEIFFDLLSLDSLRGLLYPLYANAHPEIIRKALDMGLGFLCTSRDEIKRVLGLCSEFDSERIVMWDDGSIHQESGPTLPLGRSLIVKDPIKSKSGPSALHDRDLYLFLESDTISESESWPGLNPKGFYVDEIGNHASSDDLDKMITLLTKASASFPEASDLILGNSKTVGLEFGETGVRGLGNYLESVHDACPQLALRLEVPLDLLSTIGALLVRVKEVKKNQGECHIRINTEINDSMHDQPPKAGCHILNLSKSHEEKASIIPTRGWKQDTLIVPDHIMHTSPIEKGDIVLIPDMGLCWTQDRLGERIRNGVPESYLSARRLCPVKI
ncbi:MAG: hypothetical protein JW932_19805 [Deltaproteobacteria bacterium]|nr:hypothetical protein [Deltaproteobacteria bacterium]